MEEIGATFLCGAELSQAQFGGTIWPESEDLNVPSLEYGQIVLGSMVLETDETLDDVNVNIPEVDAIQDHVEASVHYRQEITEVAAAVCQSMLAFKTLQHMLEFSKPISDTDVTGVETIASSITSYQSRVFQEAIKIDDDFHGFNGDWRVDVENPKRWHRARFLLNKVLQTVPRVADG